MIVSSTNWSGFFSSGVIPRKTHGIFAYSSVIFGVLVNTLSDSPKATNPTMLNTKRERIIVRIREYTEGFL